MRRSNARFRASISSRGGEEPYPVASGPGWMAGNNDRAPAVAISESGPEPSMEKLREQSKQGIDEEECY
jgi:hypothetical protein